MTNLEIQQAKLLAELAREAPDGIPMRPGHTPTLIEMTPERIAALEERRRAHNSRVSRRLIRRLKSRSPKCYLCRQQIGADFEIDHIIPLSRGGTHTEENLALTHSRCNNRKAALIVSIDVTTRKPRFHK